MVERGRARGGAKNPPRGERHGRAKLSDKQAEAIRADSRKHRIIAEYYGISKPLVSMIKSGKRRAT